MDKIIKVSELMIFGHRKLVVALFAVVTVVLLFMASQLKLEIGRAHV